MLLRFPLTGFQIFLSGLGGPTLGPSFESCRSTAARDATDLRFCGFRVQGFARKRKVNKNMSFKADVEHEVFWTCSLPGTGKWTMSCYCLWLELAS